MSIKLFKNRWKELDKSDKLLITVFTITLPIDVIIGLFNYFNQNLFSTSVSIAIFFLDIYFLIIVVDESEILRKFTSKFH